MFLGASQYSYHDERNEGTYPSEAGRSAANADSVLVGGLQVLPSGVDRRLERLVLALERSGVCVRVLELSGELLIRVALLLVGQCKRLFDRRQRLLGRCEFLLGRCERLLSGGEGLPGRVERCLSALELASLVVHADAKDDAAVGHALESVPRAEEPAVELVDELGVFGFDGGVGVDRGGQRAGLHIAVVLVGDEVRKLCAAARADGRGVTTL